MPDEIPSTEIRFLFDSKGYLDRVRESKSIDEWIEISIRVGNEYIYGDEENGVTGLAYCVTLGFLESVEKIIKGQEHVIEFEYGPTWLVIEPKNQDEVIIARSTRWSGVKNPDERLEIDTNIRVPKTEWATAVISVVEEFVHTVVEIDPEISHSDELEELENYLSQIKALSS
ncbi:hypothetical protein [Haloarchaeobius sp. DYHT-AS-18]|uniref:hypothetical protein n=1 Tax=Haloarchaeobius sp. DYHT-AS-18 TaxID=3446117 RepID=UPI003EC0899A